MLGILTYAALAAGFGQYLPTGGLKDDNFGLRLSVGYALLLIVFFLSAVVAKTALRASLALTVVLAAAGLVIAVRRSQRHRAVPWLHPGVVLLALGAGAVLANGGIGYVPYLHDEFTNWIGASRFIHWAGRYEEVRQTIHLPGYTPGWRLLLLLPWQVGGEIELGLSAAAPFVFHVAVLALVFDMVRRCLRQDAGLNPAASQLWAWVVVLLFLAAEGMGSLWTRELLIEQPQIYASSAVVLLILRSELWDEDRPALYLAAGLLLAAGYLLKNAALAAVPAIALLALLPLLEAGRPWAARLRDAAVAGTRLLGPVMLVMIAWGALAPADSCITSPRALLTGSGTIDYDWVDLARRFTSAVAGYVASYKLVLTVAAVAGLLSSVWAGYFRAVLVWAGFTAIYMASLYWFHLTCFGDYYFHELNSIPRFTRVPLQIMHALGLTALVILAVRAAHRRPIMAAWPVGRLQRRPALILAAGLVVALGLWQVRSVGRSVLDVTTRELQRGDPRIGEMIAASRFIERHAGRDLPARPSLAVLAQGMDNSVLAYAEFHGLRQGAGGPKSVFVLYPRISWAPEPQNIWQTGASAAEVVTSLKEIDVLWPIRLDAWLREVLAELVPDRACLDALPEFALVRSAAPSGEVEFRCVRKAS